MTIFGHMRLLAFFILRVVTTLHELANTDLVAVVDQNHISLLLVTDIDRLFEA